MKLQKPQKTPGRPRAFDPDTALDQAVEVFRSNGYEGTTLPDLTHAMGINRPSLYATFGNKEELFRKALERYSEGICQAMQTALGQPTAREVVATLLRGSAAGASDPSHPRGCLLVTGALVGSADAEPIRQELEARRKANEMLLRQRFERAQSEGDLPSIAEPADLARLVMTIHQGLIVQAVSGVSASELERVVELALHFWPTSAN